MARDSDLTDVGALWERTSANGNEYMGGNVEEEVTIPAGAFLMVFPNNSENPKAPAFRVVFAPPKDDYQPRQKPSGGAFSKFRKQGQPQHRYVNPSPSEITDDDIDGTDPIPF